MTTSSSYLLSNNHPLKLSLTTSPPQKHFLIAYGNLLTYLNKPHIWCLFCGEDKQLCELLLPLEIIPLFHLGSCFDRGYLTMTCTAPVHYKVLISAANSTQPLKRKFWHSEIKKLQGGYQQQLSTSVRNKQILLPDLLLKTLCPAAEFTKIALELCAQSILFLHVLAEGTHLHIELDKLFNIPKFTATARQLAWLASDEYYRSWHRSLAMYAGEALASPEGKPWRCPLPQFKFKVDYTVTESPSYAPYYRVFSARPNLPMPYTHLTFHVHGKRKAQTFTL